MKCGETQCIQPMSHACDFCGFEGGEVYLHCISTGEVDHFVTVVYSYDTDSRSVRLPSGCNFGKLCLTCIEKFKILTMVAEVANTYERLEKSKELNTDLVKYLYEHRKRQELITLAEVATIGIVHIPCQMCTGTDPDPHRPEVTGQEVCVPARIQFQG